MPFGMTQTYHAGQGIATRGTVFLNYCKIPSVPVGVFTLAVIAMSAG